MDSASFQTEARSARVDVKGEEEDSSADIWMQKLKSINVEMETKLKLKFDLLKAK